MLEQSSRASIPGGIALVCAASVFAQLLFVCACTYRIQSNSNVLSQLSAPNKLDLGTGHLGQTVEGRLAMRNDRSSALDLSFRTGCTCLTVAPSTVKLLPGDKLDLLVRRRLPSRVEDLSANTLEVISADQVEPIYEVLVIAKVVQE